MCPVPTYFYGKKQNKKHDKADPILLVFSMCISTYIIDGCVHTCNKTPSLDGLSLVMTVKVNKSEVWFILYILFYVI